MEKIEEWHYLIAKNNGIKRQTVYLRVRNGWPVKTAIEQVADHNHNSKRMKSVLMGCDRGKLRSFRLPVEAEDKWELMVKESGKTELDLATEIILKVLL